METLVKKTSVKYTKNTSKKSVKKAILLSDFSFSKSQKNLENYKGSLSDAIIEDRRL